MYPFLRLQAYYLRKRYDPESIEFYRKLQNLKVKQIDAYPREVERKRQLEALKRYGLEPSDDLLDVGCGNAAAGQYMIDYLNHGSYHGMDISQEAIKQAKKKINTRGLENKDPTFVNNNDLGFREFDEKTFDYIWANSVFTHLNKEHISEFLKNAKRVLHEDGQGLVTFKSSGDSDKKKITNNVASSNQYFYQPETLIEIGERHNLEISYSEDIPEWPPNVFHMLEFKK